MDDLISRKDAIDALCNIDEYNMLSVKTIRELPSAQPETHEERTETHACDLISRQAAINALTSHIMPHNNEDGTVTIGVLSKSSIKNILNKLPSAQPEQTNSWCINSWCVDCKEYDTENKCCPRYNRVIKQTLDEAYRHGETEAEARYHAQQRWIPCSERLPEEDVEVLISYRYKEGEGDTSHTYIDITTYGQMYFGGNKVGDHKHWRAPFEYFESNYEVIAWMPLPEPYAERRTDG